MGIGAIGQVELQHFSGEALAPQQSEALLGKPRQHRNYGGGREDPDIEDCLTHEFRLAPISDRSHEISADETVDDGQAVRCEQQQEECGEKPFCFPTGLGVCEDCDGSRESRCQ